MKFKISIFLGILVLLSSCAGNRPISTTKAKNNQTYEIDYLFDHLGIKMYRFRDNGNYVYFSVSDNVNQINNVTDSITISTFRK